MNNSVDNELDQKHEEGAESKKRKIDDYIQSLSDEEQQQEYDKIDREQLRRSREKRAMILRPFWGSIRES